MCLSTSLHLCPLRLADSGLVQLACLFFPKMYVVLCKPEKNTRDAVMSHRNATFVTTACHAAPVVLINGSGATRGQSGNRRGQRSVERQEGSEVSRET